MLQRKPDKIISDRKWSDMGNTPVFDATFNNTPHTTTAEAT